MSDNIESAPASGDGSDRRTFLSRSSIMLALLAIAGGEGTADAAEIMRASGPVSIHTSDVQPLNSALDAAISPGRIDKTSPSFLKLSPALQSSLGSLTSSDLAVLANAKSILKLRLANLDGDNNGTIGM